MVSFSGDPDVELLIAAAMDDMTANGAEVIEVAIPGGRNIEPLFDEFRFAIDDYLAEQPGAPVRSLREIVDLNVHHPAVDEGLRGHAEVTSLDTDAYREAVEGQHVFRDAVVALMDEHDLDAIAYPESERPAALIGGSQDAFNCDSAAYGGLPAMAIPAGFTSDGVPVGFELMGRPFAEPTLIAMAAGYEAHTDHRILPPTTPPV
jgi:Asp-tRNA(Asn)/Glu-tRNA(Gln) amidotransferase A subunit family amidase